jgi:hypothetical protein
MANLVDGVVVWINAFIPREVPGVTELITSGPYVGKTALPLPKKARAGLLNLHKPIGTGYLTDQRQFSRSTTASARMQSIARIELYPYPKLANNFSQTSGTTEVNIDSGQKQMEAIADMSGCYIEGIHEAGGNRSNGLTKEEGLQRLADVLGRVARTGQTSDSNIRADINNYGASDGTVWTTSWSTMSNNDPYAASIYVRGAASDPLVYASPNIDYRLTFIVYVDRKNSRLRVAVIGYLDAFPAFEAYAIHAGVTKTLFQVPPPPGNTPFDLLGDASSPIASAVDFS